MLIILEVQFSSWYLHFGNLKVLISKSNGECLDSLACCFYFLQHHMFPPISFCKVKVQTWSERGREGGIFVAVVARVGPKHANRTRLL